MTNPMTTTPNETKLTKSQSKYVSEVLGYESDDDMLLLTVDGLIHYHHNTIIDSVTIFEIGRRGGRTHDMNLYDVDSKKWAFMQTGENAKNRIKN